jgi:hypothetical protein
MEIKSKLNGLQINFSWVGNILEKKGLLGWDWKFMVESGSLNKFKLEVILFSEFKNLRLNGLNLSEI